MYVSGVNVSIL